MQKKVNELLLNDYIYLSVDVKCISRYTLKKSNQDHIINIDFLDGASE